MLANLEGGTLDLIRMFLQLLPDIVLEPFGTDDLNNVSNFAWS